MNGKNVNLPEDSNSLQGFAVINELHEAYPNSKKKKWPWVVIVLCLLLLLAFLVGIPWYLEAKGSEKFPQTLAGQVPVESRPTPQPEKALALPQVQTLEELVANSGLVVLGEVVGYSERFTLRSADGGEAEFAEYYVQVGSFLRGWDERDVIPVRTELALASLEKGRYLLFLYEPVGNDTGFETGEGGYYRLTAEQEGAFLRDDSQTPPAYRCTEQGLEMGGVISEMTAQIKAADEAFPYVPAEKPAGRGFAQLVK